MDINESEVTKESIYIKEHRNTYVIGKRLFDIVFSVILIILLSPIFLTVVKMY